MTASRSSLLVALGLAFGLSGNALAQQEPTPLGHPRMLEPPRSLEAPRSLDVPATRTPAPVIQRAAPVQRAPSPGSRTPVSRSGGRGIQVDRLQALDVDAGGVLSVAQGGLGPSLWYGTKRDLVDSLLGHLPAEARSPAMRSLMRRLLMTAGAPPEGEGTPGSLMERRLGLLTRMGDLEGAGALLGAVPSRARTEPMARLEADSLMLAADAPKACALAANQVHAVDAPYWQKLLAFCQTLAGEGGKAMLAAELLREMGDPDTAFYSLLETLNGIPGAPLDGLSDPAPLHVAMARTARVALPPEATQGDHPAVLRAIALDGAVPLPTRLAAAERAEAMGSLPALVLRDLYSQVPFTEEELANPLSAAGLAEAPEPAPEAEPEPVAGATPTDAEAVPEDEVPMPEVWDPALRARALLIYTALRQDVTAARAEALSAALGQAAAEGRYSAAARVLSPALEALEPSASLVWLARDMVRALVFAGRIERAGAWYRLLKGNAALNPESAKVTTQLKPLMFLAGAKEAADFSPRDLASWLPTAGEGPAWSAGRLFTLVETFEVFIPDGLWARVPLNEPVATVAMADAALLRRLELAARRGRTGEAVLLALVAIGADGPDQAHPMVLGEVVKALRAIGLEDAARGLAVEAMVAGLP